MLIKEAIKMLSKMNPNEEVFIQFKEDVTEYRNNEHLKNIPQPPEFPKHQIISESGCMDERDLHYIGGR